MTLRLAQFTICVVCARAVDNLCIGNVYYAVATKKYPRNVLLDLWNVLNQRTFMDKSAYLIYSAIYDTLPVIYAKIQLFMTLSQL